MNRSGAGMRAQVRRRVLRFFSGHSIDDHGRCEPLVVELLQSWRRADRPNGSAPAGQQFSSHFVTRMTCSPQFEAEGANSGGVAGEPAVLYSDWQKRLGLTLDEVCGKFVPAAAILAPSTHGT
jgi:hypothetical protein